jgi:hypothetical protein
MIQTTLQIPAMRQLLWPFVMPGSHSSLSMRQVTDCRVLAVLQLNTFSLPSNERQCDVDFDAVSRMTHRVTVFTITHILKQLELALTQSQCRCYSRW